MTHNIFFISDTHFGHSNILTFKRKDGSPVRSFSSVEEMDETIIENWNKVVRPVDKIYHLGDVVIARRNLQILERLNGKKRLVRGNHDIFKTKDYLKYFDEIYGVRVFPEWKIICSHIPVHTSQMEYRFKLNVHGHLHEKTLDDNRYLNVSCERINFTPISIEEILSIGNINHD